MKLPPPDALLAWRPFLEPIDLHDGWWLTLVPLAFFLSMGYKAIRVTTLDRYWRGVLVMTIQVLLLMVALAVAAHFVLEILVPLLR